VETLYVFSGSLKGVEVVEDCPEDAVRSAVLSNLPCVLSSQIRVSLSRSPHSMDVYYYAPYEDILPELFSEDIDVRVIAVESTRQ